MDSGGLRRKDTTKGPPLRILTLDGGGVRGYSMLIIVQELMHRTFVEMEGRAPKRNEIPKPCDHFDLIVGTGTGGLIALMLGRMRLSLQTCKDVYVRMTKRVFETDKTIAGIPYRSTLFKASKLEEAIRDCVREHTMYEDEGGDEGESPPPPMTPGSVYSARMPSRSLSVASRYSQIGNISGNQDHRGSMAARWGKPNALLYDNRENRTKTAVTAVYKGSTKGTPPALLRSYDSRKETAPEEKCTIWQAGRATSATALAFKPIQVGQSVFLDEGGGKYNPSPIALDEALINEWPGREIGVFISVGTGKRPEGTNSQQHLWWEGFVSTGLGDFAEAKRRLIAKIEGCESTHQDMLKMHLAERGVNMENYYRLNVEVGVGEFGMNEWHRLADISTSTRMYLGQGDIQRKNISAATKLARIQNQNIRYNRAMAYGDGGYANTSISRLSWEDERPTMPEPPAVPGAVELPAEDVDDAPPPSRPPPLHPISPSSRLTPSGHLTTPTASYHTVSDDDKLIVHADEPYRYEPRPSGDHARPQRLEPQVSNSSLPQQPRRSGEHVDRPMAGNTPPPIPPKTPIPGYVYPATGSGPPRMQGTMNRPPAGVMPPYPDTNGPPPVVNVARKPEFGVK